VNKASYKKRKMGCLPGDYPKGVKIRMLESAEPFQYGEEIGVRAIKSFRKKHRRKAEKTFRQMGKQVTAETYNAG
jgi:hypothetical protein